VTMLKKCHWRFLSRQRPRVLEILSSGELRYSTRDGKELGRVSLKGASVQPSRNDRDLVVTSAAGEVLQLRAADAEECDTWTRLLTQAQV